MHLVLSLRLWSRTSGRLVVALCVLGALGLMTAPASAIPGAECRLSGDATITTGDSASGRAKTTDLVANLGTGRWRHFTATGERFDGRLSVLGCHSNTGDIADIEGTGSFRGSSAVLVFFAHIEDRTRLGEPDLYTIAIFNGTTLVYNTIGDVVSGGFTVTISP